MKKRIAVRSISGFPARDGAGVKLRRMIGHEDVDAFDPFLMLDLFGSKDPKDYLAGFPWHPHRGIETVTFLMSGSMAHGDSLGHAGTIGPDDVQWMTAGSGIVHQEMPQRSDELAGLQLWVNLPAAQKMTAPRYQDIPAAGIPAVEEPGARFRVIAGVRGTVKGPVTDLFVDPTFLDATLAPDARADVPVDPGATCFAVVVKGSLSVVLDDGRTEEAAAPRVVRFADGDAVGLEAGAEGARVLFVAGRPLHEPVAWGGPIVMNTREELRRAFQELEDGTFLKHA